jgi:hypothetical protein
MEYTNSLLIDCELRSPYNSGRRTRSIDRITPHCVVGQLSAEETGNCFLQAVEASCNYGIGKDGRVCLVFNANAIAMIGGRRQIIPYSIIIPPNS